MDSVASGIWQSCKEHEDAEQDNRQENHLIRVSKASESSCFRRATIRLMTRRLMTRETDCKPDWAK